MLWAGYRSDVEYSSLAVAFDYYYYGIVGVWQRGQHWTDCECGSGGARICLCEWSCGSCDLHNVCTCVLMLLLLDDDHCNPVGRGIVCMSVCLSVRLSQWMCVCTCVCVCVSVSVCARPCMCVCACACVCYTRLSYCSSLTGENVTYSW